MSDLGWGRRCLQPVIFEDQSHYAKDINTHLLQSACESCDIFNMIFRAAGIMRWRTLGWYAQRSSGHLNLLDIDVLYCPFKRSLLRTLELLSGEAGPDEDVDIILPACSKLELLES